jgi:hypothetical protein
MTEKYFQKFPIIRYNGVPVVDITKRAAVRSAAFKNPLLYYPYDLTNGERPDIVADKFYKDEYMAWIVYLANGVIDPYYDWVMDEQTFSDFITKKYGSIEESQRRIMAYRSNWHTDQRKISTVQYNSLPDIQKVSILGNVVIDTAARYYQPVLGAAGAIDSYERKKCFEVLATNRVVRYGVSGNTTFTMNETVTVALAYKDGSNNHTYSTSGRGQVAFSNSSIVVVQHTSGITDTPPSGRTFDLSVSNNYVSGHSSGANSTVTSVTTEAINIYDAEAIYWEPVTAYDFEVEKNMRNKTIRLMDPGYAQQAADELTKTLAV